MHLSINTTMFCFIALSLAACAGSKTVYRQDELNIPTIKKEFIDKKRAVKLRFFVKKDLMYEETGYITSSTKEDHVVFQYYDHTQRNYINMELPLKNISEISYKKGAFEFDQSTRIAGAAAITVTIFIALSLWTQ